MRVFTLVFFSVVVFTIILDFSAFYLTQHVPEDAVFNLGPVLGILKEGRVVDLLVYKDYNTYFGYPPLFFIPQALWYGIVGIDSGLVWAFVVMVHVTLVATFLYVFWKVIQQPVFLGLLVLSYCSGVYYLSGRPDPIVLIFIFLLIHQLLKLIRKFELKYLWLSALVLVAIFFIHPLAFILSSFVFFGSLILQYRVSHIKILLFSAFLVCVFILLIYLPFIFSDFESWKALFLGLSKNQERFKIESFTKFVGLNVGGFLSIAFIVIAGGWTRFKLLFRNNLFKVSCIAMFIPFFWGMSYYFLFVFPFLFVAIVFVSIGEIKEVKPWLYLSLTFCAIISLYQGSLGRVVQGLREPEYARYLHEARKKAKTITCDGSVYADSQLVADLVHLKDLNLLWHGMKYYRMDVSDGAVYVFIMDDSWLSNRKNLGRWDDTNLYDMVYQGSRARGLPALYGKSRKGPELELRIIKAKN